MADGDRTAWHARQAGSDVAAERLLARCDRRASPVRPVGSGCAFRETAGRRCVGP